MNALETTKQNELEFKIQTGLQTIDYFIRRNYLARLSECKVRPIQVQKDSSLIRLFHVDKIIYCEDEDVQEKLTSVYSALQNLNATVYILIIGKATGVEFYIGARSETAAGIPADVLRQSFEANFPGSHLVGKESEELRAILDSQQFENISSVTVVPSVREDNEKNFVQGMEKLIDSMRGKKYSAMFISTPISKAELDRRRLGLEQLYSVMSPYTKTSVAYGENESRAISNGTFENFSTTINEGISNTFGTSISVSDNRSYSTSLGGFSSSSGHSTSISNSSSDTTSRGSAETTGHGKNKNETITTGSTLTFTNDVINKTVENVLSYIDEQFERIKNYEAFGAWETAAYFCADKIEDCLVSANAFKALVSGEKTNSEYAHINVWGRENAHTSALADYLRYCTHPVFEIDGNEFVEPRCVTAGTYISGKELPIFMSLPQKSVSGITVTSMAEFSRNVSHRTDEVAVARKWKLGCIHHMGKDETENKVILDLDSLTSHCFVCGSTGSGKSNTTYHLLHRLIRGNIPFLVIEPAKGEYKTEFGSVPGINIFGSNPYMGALLKINPFEFHPQIHILEHLDRLIEIFNACWEMYAAMPAILKNAVETAYVRKGWDLLNSIYIGEGQPRFPTFDDLLTTLPEVIQTSSYSADTQGDYTGALVTRVHSLTNGITGQIFCDSYSISDSVLFDETTIVDLSRIGSTETKSLITGILVMRLTEYRMANSMGSNRELCHVTILEEAHNLLKNVSQAQGQQTANPVGKSVEMICNSIAEMRTYGEGFVVVDQSPSAVDIAAIKNTNTKIAMRLPEKADCEAVGNSLGLNDAQMRELSKLPVGVAAVLQNNWLEAVLCKIDKVDSVYHKETEKTDFEAVRKLRSIVLCTLLEQANDKTGDSLDYSAVADAVHKTDASEHLKRELLDRARRFFDNSFGNAINYVALGEFADKLIGASNAFLVNEHLLVGKEDDRPSVLTWEAHMIYRLSIMIALRSEENYKYLLRLLLYRYTTLPVTSVDYSKVFSTQYLNS